MKTQETRHENKRFLLHDFHKMSNLIIYKTEKYEATQLKSVNNLYILCKDKLQLNYRLSKGNLPNRLLIIKETIAITRLPHRTCITKLFWFYRFFFDYISCRLLRYLVKAIKSIQNLKLHLHNKGLKVFLCVSSSEGCPPFICMNLNFTNSVSWSSSLKMARSKRSIVRQMGVGFVRMWERLFEVTDFVGVSKRGSVSIF